MRFTVADRDPIGGQRERTRRGSISSKFGVRAAPAVRRGGRRWRDSSGGGAGTSGVARMPGGGVCVRVVSDSIERRDRRRRRLGPSMIGSVRRAGRRRPATHTAASRAGGRVTIGSDSVGVFDSVGRSSGRLVAAAPASAW
jgi:hypothetical protein